MSKTVAISEAVTLKSLRQHFGLRPSEDRDFFGEWRDLDPCLTETDQQVLDRIQQRYRYYIQEDLMLEESIKMMIVSPLLEMAGFYDFPFRTQFEDVVEIIVESEDLIYRGRLDTLTIQALFWVMVVEAKRSSVSIEAGIPQALAYMLGTPYPKKPAFGLVTNGSSFIFLKSLVQKQALYAKSAQFATENDGDLGQVVQIMRHIANEISASEE